MKNHKNIIEFYKKQVYLKGMLESDELTDVQLIELGETLWFSTWMLSMKYQECIKAIKNIL